MPRIILEGGTDVAEMSLFDRDDLPAPEKLDDESLSELENRNLLLRLPTGADGGYLLYLYLDEPIPNEIMKYCVQDDTLETDFETPSGQIAFGGTESAVCDYKPNSAIRSDCSIPSGTYRSTAYHTDFPEGLYEEALTQALGRTNKLLVELPGYIVIGTVLITIFFLFLGLTNNQTPMWWPLVSVSVGILMFKGYTRLQKYKNLDTRRSEIARGFPSIVIYLETQLEERL